MRRCIWILGVGIHGQSVVLIVDEGGIGVRVVKSGSKLEFRDTITCSARGLVFVQETWSVS